MHAVWLPVYPQLLFGISHIFEERKKTHNKTKQIIRIMKDYTMRYLLRIE